MLLYKWCRVCGEVMEFVVDRREHSPTYSLTICEKCHTPTEGCMSGRPLLGGSALAQKEHVRG